MEGEEAMMLGQAQGRMVVRRDPFLLDYEYSAF